MCERMLRPIPLNSCPKCHHQQFLVKTVESTIFFTDRNGVIVHHQPEIDMAFGKCLNCGYECDMMSTLVGFMPLTPLRKILFDFQHDQLNDNEFDGDIEDNPMDQRWRGEDSC